MYSNTPKRSMHLSALTLATAILIAGCASGPDYQAPAVNDISAARFHNAGLLTTRNAATAVAPMPSLDQ